MSRAVALNIMAEVNEAEETDWHSCASDDDDEEGEYGAFFGDLPPPQFFEEDEIEIKLDTLLKRERACPDVKLESPKSQEVHDGSKSEEKLRYDDKPEENCTTGDNARPPLISTKKARPEVVKFHVSYSDLYIKQHQLLATSSHASSRGLDGREVQKIYRSMSPVERLLDFIRQVRFQCGRVVNNVKVQYFVVYLIALNGLMMGLATFDFVREDPQVEHAFEMCDQVLLILFTIELGMQFIFYGWRLILDGWLVFDLIIITCSWAFSAVQIIRSFRIFRAFRLITRIKVLKNLVTALFQVIPRMFAIGILLTLLSYIFAVMFTQLFKNLYEEGYTGDVDYFGRLDLTYFTLWQIMTLDGWAGIARQVIDAPDCHWAWFPFVVYVILTAFVIVNLIIAVICDAVSALEGEERAKLEGRYEEEQENLDDDDDDNNNNRNGNSGLGREEMSQPLYLNLQQQLDSLEDNVSELVQLQVSSMKMLTGLILDLKSHRDIETMSQSSHAPSINLKS